MYFFPWAFTGSIAGMFNFHCGCFSFVRRWTLNLAISGNRNCIWTKKKNIRVSRPFFPTFIPQKKKQILFTCVCVLCLCSECLQTQSCSHLIATVNHKWKCACQPHCDWLDDRAIYGFSICYFASAENVDVDVDGRE